MNELTGILEQVLKTYDSEVHRAAGDLYDEDNARWIEKPGEWSEHQRKTITAQRVSGVERMAVGLVGQLVNARADGSFDGTMTTEGGDVWTQFRAADQAVTKATREAAYMTAGDAGRRAMAEVNVNETIARAKRESSRSIHGGPVPSAVDTLTSYYRDATPEEKAVMQDRREGLLSELGTNSVPERMKANDLRRAMAEDYERRIVGDASVQRALQSYQNVASQAFDALDALERVADKFGTRGHRYIDQVKKAFSFDAEPYNGGWRVTFNRHEFNSFGEQGRAVESYSAVLTEKADRIKATTTRRMLKLMREKDGSRVESGPIHTNSLRRGYVK